ncbi:MAG: DUF433 domain-containing protein [Candidatus Odinarchaeota archaeon]
MLVVPHIEVDLGVCGDKPCIVGTRLAITIILEWLKSGKTFPDILDAYPFLTIEDLQAAIRYARLTIAGEEIIPFDVAKKVN